MLISRDRLIILAEENCLLETKPACLIRLLREIRKFEERVAGDEALTNMASHIDHEVSLRLLAVLDAPKLLLLTRH